MSEEHAIATWADDGNALPADPPLPPKVRTKCLEVGRPDHWFFTRNPRGRRICPACTSQRGRRRISTLYTRPVWVVTGPASAE
jgi:hypothetical protein